jgi:lipid II:glycine glycyltransferase (peptidoglycan interpeptide bridge formation enzyme)
MSNEFFFAKMREDHGEVLAAALVNIDHDLGTDTSSATYLHGASSRSHRELMSPYLLHWRIIQAAKRRNIRYYDFWGIDEKRWPGITWFNTGFGGSHIEYPLSLHIIYRPVWYCVYKLITWRWR